MNKVNTKATAKCQLSAAWVPKWAEKALRRNVRYHSCPSLLGIHTSPQPAYVSATNSLQVTSTAYRSQAQNVDDCRRKVSNCLPTAVVTFLTYPLLLRTKLHSIIVDAALDGVKGETSEAQKQRVVGLQRAEKARRRENKEYKSKVKQSRKKGDWD